MSFETIQLVLVLWKMSILVTRNFVSIKKQNSLFQTRFEKCQIKTIKQKDEFFLIEF